MILIIADSDIQGTLVSDGHCSVLSLETQLRTGPASEPMMGPGASVDMYTGVQGSMLDPLPGRFLSVFYLMRS